MSLSSLLSIPEINKKFSETFPKPRFNLKEALKALPLTNRYSFVGTAFDYLLRFIVERENLDKKIIKNNWVAKRSLDLLEDKKIKKRAYELLNKTIMLYKQYIKTGIMNRKLIRNSLFLAQLDTVFRAGLIVENLGKLDKIKGIEKDVMDLENLISIIPKEQFKAKELVALNPTFGKGSELVGGADADLIIDDKLIEIKTTKKLELNRKHLNQLIGYFVLYKINNERIDKLRKKISINELGMYFSRYGLLFTFKIDDVTDSTKLKKFIQWFKKKVKEYEDLFIIELI